MNKATLIVTSDWEGLFVNGKLVEEGHTLNQGHDRIRYFQVVAKRYNFNLNDLEVGRVTAEYEKELEDCGSFPESVEDVQYYLLEVERKAW